MADWTEYWRKYERTCGHPPFKAQGEKPINIKKALQVLNRNPLRWDHTMNDGGYTTSCGARKKGRGTCFSMAYDAYARLRKTRRYSDNDLVIVWGEFRIPEHKVWSHALLKVGGWAVDYFPGYWPKPYYAIPMLRYRRKHSFFIKRKYNLFTG